jgi:tRNA (adenine22-N1)-methyltransferase
VQNNRIDIIIKQIKTSGRVIDVGSDHAQLAIRLLKKHQATHVYNVEVHKEPYQTTVRNLQSHGLLAQTTNILGDGLQTHKIDKPIKYCVIAGMGTKNIINILTRANQQIKIQEFILVPNNNAGDLRDFLMQNDYKFKFEQIIEERGYYYALMVVSKTKGLTIHNKFDSYYGPYNLKHPSKTFQQMHQQRKQHILKNALHTHNKHIQAELNLLEENKI